MAVLLVDHLAPRPRRDLRSRERVEAVLVEVVAARFVVACERLKRLDRVEDIARVWAFGDAVRANKWRGGGRRRGGRESCHLPGAVDSIRRCILFHA
jgi:hypothetical protein